jgi:hypothetical protein
VVIARWACLVGGLVLVAFVSACGPPDESVAAHWIGDIADEFKGVEIPVSQLPDPPSAAKLRAVSEVGFDTGKGVEDTAPQLADDADVEVKEAQELYCKFFLEYLKEGEGEEENLTTWILGHLPKTPPQRYESIVNLFSEARSKADSLDEEAINTASAAVCSF